MKILHVNHRDIHHPNAGGLEVLVHEISRRWIQNGHEVSLLCAGFPNAPKMEMVDGIRTHRLGREQVFNFMAGFWLRRHDWLGADVVIEHLAKVACGLPCFAPGRPLVGHVPHLFGKSIFEEVALPLGAYVYGMERLLPALYRQIPMWVISESTRDDLCHLGLKRENLQVIHPGIETAFFDVPPHPAPDPALLFVGRIRKYKGLGHPLLSAWELVLKEFPKARLQIVGRGNYEEALRREIAQRGLTHSIQMTGFVDENQKRELIRSAWLMVYPSVKEGWGLPVIEAAAVGIPTVASDSPGLRESVRDGETGLLVPHGDPNALAEAILLLLRDETLRHQMGAAAKQWSRNFDWDRMAREVLGLVERSMIRSV